jgi:pilus assembly protein CpaF
MPLVDARLADGSRVNVALPPLAVDGPTLTIRRFQPQGFSLDRLVDCGCLDSRLAGMLACAVADGLNLLVSGATGSGKTTTLGALARAIPASQRVVTIEDAAELRLDHPHVVRLEARPPGPGGGGEVVIRDLVRNSLRMRPDRLVIGEVRGPEAADMLDAMATGHAGSLSTVHAGSPRGALERLATLAHQAALGLPHEAVTQRIAAAIDLVVQQCRLPSGARVVSSVAVVGWGDGLTVDTIFRLEGGQPVWRVAGSGDARSRLRFT